MLKGRKNSTWSNRKALLVILIIALILVSVFILSFTGYFSKKTENNKPITQDEIPPSLRIVEVSSIDSMMSAITKAKPGDHIILQNGVYDTTNWLNEHEAKNMLVRGIYGNDAAPIVIQAETVGGVVLVGSGGFRFSDVAYLIISGFKFNHSQDSSESTDDSAIQCKLCKFVRFTRNEFALETTTNIHSDWLQITSGLSEHNRIDHNTFRNKHTLGVFLFIFGGKDGVAKYTLVDHNYFFDQSNKAGNGGECIRIGNSAQGLKSAFTTIEYNLFEQCNGDSESITVKSSDNLIRWNTFNNNHGSLTFRHGNNNVADGNIFVNGQGGIRVYGHDHKIINNYFENNVGTGVRKTLVVGTGTIDTDLSRSNNEHSQPQNILVSHNTLLNNLHGIVIGDEGNPLSPINVIIVDNIVVGNSGSLIEQIAGEAKYDNNIIFGNSTTGNVPQSGWVNIDPVLSRNKGLERPISGSPAINSVSSATNHKVDHDINGNLRDSMEDIGAEEYLSGKLRYPLTRSSVGPYAK